MGVLRTAVAGALLLAACGPGPTSAPATEPTASPAPTVTVYRLVGSVTLRTEYLNIDSERGCFGTGGYDDIARGLGVVVRDGAGVVLATGALGKGRIVAALQCGFEFVVEAVPAAAFYSIEVGHRGEITYSFADVEAAEWYVELSLGD